MRDIPLCKRVHMHALVCVYDIFLNQSSVDGHLGCFHILAIVSDAVMNVGVHVSF